MNKKHHVWEDPQHLFLSSQNPAFRTSQALRYFIPLLTVVQGENPRSCLAYQPSATESLSIIGGAFNVPGKDQQQCCHVHWCHIDGLENLTKI